MSSHTFFLYLIRDLVSFSTFFACVWWYWNRLLCIKMWFNDFLILCQGLYYLYKIGRSVRFAHAFLLNYYLLYYFLIFSSLWNMEDWSFAKNLNLCVQTQGPVDLKWACYILRIFCPTSFRRLIHFVLRIFCVTVKSLRTYDMEFFLWS